MKAVFLDAKTLGDDVDLSPIESVTGGLEKYERTAPDDVLERIRGFDTVLVNKVVLTREHFEACPELKTIAVVATGLNNIDQAAAKGLVLLLGEDPVHAGDAGRGGGLLLLLLRG